MKCSNPIEAGVLADYWLGLLAPPDEESLEEHLLECDDCGSRLREIIALADGVRNLAREASLRMIVSDAFLERAAADGLRVSEYAPPTGGGVNCTVTADDDILIGRLTANLAGAKQVDLSLCDQDGAEQLRMRDIPVHAGTRDIVLQESITAAKAAPTNKMIVRLITFDDAGAERLLGEYTFNHTRSLPGPGGW